jgi:RNA polymerase sigma-70 factor (ECF subfamily)
VTDSSNERLLVGKLKRGDEQAFAQLIHLYEHRVYAMAYRFTGSREDAEDITQETFLGILNSLNRFRGASKLSTWVYRIAMNHCLEHVRRRKADTVPLNEELAITTSSPGDDPQRSAEQCEASDAVQSALLGLSSDHRQVVILHELQELTYGEIADALDIPVGTVKSRLFNALRKLKELLSDYVADGESV